jgi:hypothetical protein
LLKSDEGLVGGVDHGGKRGRGADKAIVVMAIEIKPPLGYGRVRMRHIPDASGDAWVPLVCDGVSPGATVETEGGGGYTEWQKNGHVHQQTLMSARNEPAQTVDSWSPPRVGQRRTSAIVPGRIYFSI